MEEEAATTIDIIKLRQEIPVTNYKTGDAGTITPLDKQLTNDEIETIVRICSNPQVFNVLFANLPAFKGRNYATKDAVHWNQEIGIKGWAHETNFVWIVRNSQGKIIAAIDIKSNNPVAEIGYWQDPSKSGWMTNVVTKITELAKEAGFEKLYGLVVPSNIASIKVLERARYKYVGKITERGKKYKRYEIELL